jgi:hypothetical protein
LAGRDARGDRSAHPSAQVQKVGVGIGEDFKQLDREHPGL